MAQDETNPTLPSTPGIADAFEEMFRLPMARGFSMWNMDDFLQLRPDHSEESLREAGIIRGVHIVGVRPDGTVCPVDVP